MPGPFSKLQQRAERVLCGDWNLVHREFSLYQLEGNSKILSWLHGIHGCSRSTLGSTIIEAVFDHCSPSHTLAVLYFYFNFNNIKKQRHEKMILYLIFQLSSQPGSAPQALESLYSVEEAECVCVCLILSPTVAGL